MMKEYYAIYDNLAGIYMTPILFNNENVALRWFNGVVNSKEANETIYNNPADFELHKIATFDDETGDITPIHEKLATGLSVKKGE